jgi:hypothetical protein
VSALPQDDTRVACLSCHYSYSSARGFCPICGTPAPTYEVLLALQEVHREATRSTRKTGERTTGPLRAAFGRLLKNPFPIVISAALLLCGWFFLHAGNAKTPAETTPVPTNTGVSAEPAPQPATAPENSHPTNPAGRALRTGSPKVGRTVVGENDPAQLWKRVGRGDTSAEVALARLYLDGTGVSQNCEQAHLLLLAASRKRYPEADRLLSGDYSQRCR